MCQARLRRRGPAFLLSPRNGVDERGDEGGVDSQGEELPLPWLLTLPRGVLVASGRYCRYRSEKGSVRGRRYLSMMTDYEKLGDVVGG